MENLVVVTGGNSGLGLELVKLFQKKYQTLVISRTKKFELKNVMYEYGDISNEQFISNVYKKYSKKYNIKYLINNAGVGRFGVPEQNCLEKINEVFAGNLIGLILNTTYAIPLIKENGGKIINIMSTAALKGNINESLYCAAKWGVRGYTESLKNFYKGTKIKVIGVYPGGMNSNFWDDNRDYVSVEKSEKWLNPADVAKVIFENVINDKLCVSDVTIERI